MSNTGRTYYQEPVSWLALWALTFPLFALPLWLLLHFCSRSVPNTAQFPAVPIVVTIS